MQKRKKKKEEGKKREGGRGERERKEREGGKEGGLKGGSKEEGKKTSFQKSMIELRMVFIGNSPVVQWLRHCTFDAKGPGSSPGGETKVPQAVPQSNPPPPKRVVFI